MRPLTHKPLLWTTAAAALLMLAATALGADKVRTQKGIGFQGDIVGLDAEGLVIQTDGVRQSVPLATIAKVESDKYLDLADAEEAYLQGLAGKPEGFTEAERLYRSVLKGGTPQWLRTLIEFRMYKVYANSGRVSQALDAYLSLARAQPKLVAGLKLPPPDETAHAANKAMLQKVDEALQAPGDKPYAVELNGLKLRLMMLEGKSDEVLPLLDPLLASPDEKTRQLAMIKQVELLVAVGKIDDASAKLDQAEPKLGEAYAADVAYWRGRILQERKQYTEAALAYMRLPILYQTNKDKARTADALWRAGQCLEAAKARPTEAVTVYREAVTKYPGTAGAAKAREDLARLGA